MRSIIRQFERTSKVAKNYSDTLEVYAGENSSE